MMMMEAATWTLSVKHIHSISHIQCTQTEVKVEHKLTIKLMLQHLHLTHTSVPQPCINGSSCSELHSSATCTCAHNTANSEECRGS